MRVAVDTSALYALADRQDQYHGRAVAVEAQFRRSGGRLVASMLVLAELHNLLLRRVDPGFARRVASAFLVDPLFEWHDASGDVVGAAIDGWLSQYSDQSFSLFDAVTFEIMRRERITHAFAYDKHFVTAGFELIGA